MAYSRPDESENRVALIGTTCDNGPIGSQKAKQWGHMPTRDVAALSDITTGHLLVIYIFLHMCFSPTFTRRIDRLCD